MKMSIFPLLGILLLMWQETLAQSETNKDYRNFPIVITLQFHALAMPFKDLKSNFKNVGLGIGTEISHGGSSNAWVQQFNMIWIRNKAIGNSLLFTTQTAWRPDLNSSLDGEIKAGIGYSYSFRPTESFIQHDGKWISVDKKGKGMLAVPIGIGLGWNNYSTNTFISPYISYQTVFLKGYNKTIPVIPQTLLEIGARLHTNEVRSSNPKSNNL